MNFDELLDLNGYGPALDPVDNWRELTDAELGGALLCRGVRPPALDVVIEHRDHPETAARIARFLDPGYDPVDAAVDRYLRGDPEP